MEILGYPGDPKFHEKCTCAAVCAKGCAKDPQSPPKVGKSPPKCLQGLHNGAKMEVQDPPETTLNGDRAQNGATCDPLTIYYV